MSGTKRHRRRTDRKTRGTDVKCETMLRATCTLVLALMAGPALAEIPDSGLLNDVTNRFLVQSATWGTVIIRYASWLFWLLATISMVWTFGMMALRKADLGEFFAEFVRFTITTGFFWWLLSNGPEMAMAIINSLRRIGAEAGDLPGSLSPSSPITIGFDIVKKAFKGLSWTHPIDNLGIVLISAAVVIAMAVVSANILIALVTAWAMAYAGVFILGFGGSRWTSDLAISYFKAMLAIGLELMTMTLLVSVAVSVIDGFYEDLDGASIYELLLVLCVCVVLALLIDKLPARVAALAGGGSGAGISAGTVMGAGAMAAAAAATAGAALVAGAASMAGGAQALMAAFSKASAFEDSGGGKGSQLDAGGYPTAGGSASSAGPGALAAAMGDSVPSSSNDLGSMDNSGRSEPVGAGVSNASDQPDQAASAGGPADGKSGGASNGATSMATKVGRIAMGTVANLAQGAWDVSKEKMATVRDSAVNRVEETTGGKIAAAIKARGSAMTPESGGSPGVHDGLAAGDRKSDPAAEIAAFRDRDGKASQK